MSTAAAARQSLLQELIVCGHFLPSGEPGIYGRGAVFEDVRTHVDRFITRTRTKDRPETPRFPPVISRITLERAGYLHSFPHLCGAVYSFAGDEFAAKDMAARADAGRNWSGHLSPTNVLLTPAACYPAYPAIAARGPLPPEGTTLDLGGSYVFRNEPSSDPARLQMFHQREMVRMGEAEQVLEWRRIWIGRARKLFAAIGLDVTLALASDPFFGRGGKLLAKAQREQGLKFEFVTAIASSEPTAIASFNFHQQHFGSSFGIKLHDGRAATTACLGFGLERITLALFRKHGMDIRDWPADVRRILWPKAGSRA